LKLPDSLVEVAKDVPVTVRVAPEIGASVCPSCTLPRIVIPVCPKSVTWVHNKTKKKIGRVILIRNAIGLIILCVVWNIIVVPKNVAKVYNSSNGISLPDGHRE